MCEGVFGRLVFIGQVRFNRWRQFGPSINSGRVKFRAFILVLACLGGFCFGDVDSGLVGWWRFEGDLVDSSGGGHHASNSSGAVWVEGRIGEGLEVDEGSDHLVVEYAPELNGAEFTVSCWVKVVGGAGTRRSVLNSRYDLAGPVPPADHRGYDLYINTHNNWCFSTGMIVGQPSVNELVSDKKAVVGRWTYLTATFEAGAISSMTLYVDGIEAGSLPVLFFTPNSQSALRIGSGSINSLPPQYFLNGLVDDVRVYNRSLSQEEVGELYSLGRPARSPSPSHDAPIVSIEADLGWSGSGAAESYDVYFGRTNPPVNLVAERHSEASFELGTLDYDETYYWRVDTRTRLGIVRGGVWSFKTGVLNGSGSEGDPYLIRSWDDLRLLSRRSAYWVIDAHFVLTDDITISEYSTVAMIGTNSAFKGVFDGCGHSIEVSDGAYYDGLFGYNRGEIRNLSVTGANIESMNDEVGILAHLNEGSISNCFVEGSVTVARSFGRSYFVGGLVGINAGEISNCSSSGLVVGCSGAGPWIEDLHAGGLVGENWGQIRACYSSCEVIENSFSCGGLVGINESAGSIQNCYSTGSVNGGTGPEFSGGLVGENSGSIDHCYSRGAVSDYAGGGGLIGLNDSADDHGSYWDTESSGVTTSDGGIGRTTEQMKQKGTFDGWDFAGDWRMCVDGVDYPRLSWEPARVGDLRCPDGVGMEDFSVLAGHWLEGVVNIIDGDSNVDGNVNFEDLMEMAANWLDLK